MKVEVKGSKLIITMDIVKGPSKSGKSINVATSGGNKVTDTIVDGKPLIVGVNAYISAK